MKKSKGLEELFLKVAQKHQIDADVVETVYQSMWGLMRKVIRELPELRKMTYKELKEFKENKDVRSSFYIPNFGKFFIDLKRAEYKEKKMN